MELASARAMCHVVVKGYNTVYSRKIGGGDSMCVSGGGQCLNRNQKSFIYFLFLLNRFVTERIQVLTAPVRLFFFLL